MVNRRWLVGPLGTACILWGVASATIAARGQIPEPAKTAATIEPLQNPDGGFGPAAGRPSTLGATSSAIRVLKNVGGSIPDVLKCIAYVKGCRDAGSGGFAPTPGGTPGVGITATGLMACRELKLVDDEIADGAIGYFSKNAKGFEDIRIAVAGMEAAGKSSPDFAAWANQVNAERNADGTFGRGPGASRHTGGAIVALLRMGIAPDSAQKAAVLDLIRKGQQPDGGWSRGDGPSDPETTYRVMRAFFMLKEKPDLGAVRRYFAAFRNPDGGYATAPGGPSEIGGSYFATTVLRWSALLDNELPIVETAGFVPLFNGRNLDGWEGENRYWGVREGMLVGTSPGIDHNTFLATEASYGDFILKASFRLVGGAGNSGIQFRSVRVPGTEMSGYQADIGDGYWGTLYDESRRNRAIATADPKALSAVVRDGWNHYVVRAMGGDIETSLNGVTCYRYKEADSGIARDGKIAIQLHSGGPTEIQLKDVLIQPLPTPPADAAKSPGFHRRTVKAADGDRTYVVFIPDGYDGARAFPAVLFLHGSGERGDDGIKGGQIGLGAAIAKDPAHFPMIAVMPQARTTWAADSADAEAALAALDDVIASFAVDPNRVILTGLSMGGAGSWGLASKHPGRFAAVVPICGRGKVETVGAFKDLPAWTIIGDADGDQSVLNTRAMVAALAAAGAPTAPRLTEYRGIGHNSWDRAYADRALIDWMAKQARKAP